MESSLHAGGMLNRIKAYFQGLFYPGDFVGPTLRARGWMGERSIGHTAL